MIAERHADSTETLTNNEVAANHRALLENVNWVVPVPEEPSLLKKAGAFGRSIEHMLRNLSPYKPTFLSLRRSTQAKAAVISDEQYQSILALKVEFARMVAVETEEFLSESASEFDALITKMQAPKSKAAVKSTFFASPEDLASTFKPGITENSA